MLGPILMVLGGVVALGFGVWVGMPGRYTQTPDDIDSIMLSGVGRRRKTKPRFTPLAWMQRSISVRGSRGFRKGRRGSGFRVERPDDR